MFNNDLYDIYNELYIYIIMNYINYKKEYVINFY